MGERGVYGASKEKENKMQRGKGGLVCVCWAVGGKGVVVVFAVWGGSLTELVAAARDVDVALHHLAPAPVAHVLVHGGRQRAARVTESASSS